MYRVYVEVNGRYQGDAITNDTEELFKLLDILILDDEYIKKVLVIEHKDDTDTTFYLYTGYYYDYILFRTNYELERDKILQPYYEFVGYKRELK